MLWIIGNNKSNIFNLELNYLTGEVLDNFIIQALKEDVGQGDHSSLASISEKSINKAHLIVKESGVLAGIELSKKIFYHVDPTLETQYFLKDGDTIKEKDIAFSVSGNARSILTAERLVLNCMQRMCGIATITNQFVKELSGTNSKILDTRKTTPNFRVCEKWAVHIGGGSNHRFGLYDMIILKDNHVDFAGGIYNAINKTVNYLQKNNLNLKIEIETRNLKEVEEVLNIGMVHRIMLDNMSLQMMKDAVKLINGVFETEASGGVTLQTVNQIAQTGVDYISAGALTHSAKNIDLSLKAYK